MKHIFLIGIMGAGKTHFAQQLQNAINLELVDLDAFIEQMYNKTIPEIFESGEHEFRRIETNALKSVIDDIPKIISTGGGAPCFNNNIETMLDNGIVIWLNPSVSTIAARLLNETAHRPLLKNARNQEEIESLLTDLLAKRATFYNQAHLHVLSDEPDMNEIISFIQKNEGFKTK